MIMQLIMIHCHAIGDKQLKKNSIFYYTKQLLDIEASK